MTANVLNSLLLSSYAPTHFCTTPLATDYFIVL